MRSGFRWVETRGVPRCLQRRGYASGQVGLGQDRRPEREWGRRSAEEAARTRTGIAATPVRRAIGRRGPEGVPACRRGTGTGPLAAKQTVPLADGAPAVRHPEPDHRGVEVDCRALARLPLRLHRRGAV